MILMHFLYKDYVCGLGVAHRSQCCMILFLRTSWCAILWFCV